MPSRKNPTYRRPHLLFSSHLETIYPSVVRRVSGLPEASRERISTPDGDFLDLFWRRQKSKDLVIIQHGLEGDAHRAYVLGMAKKFYENGFDTLTWNYRGCGKELNLLPKFYHSGATYDLQTVVEHGAKNYHKIALIGFSLGGNLTLKYLGENPDNRLILAGVAVSAPLDLAAGADNLNTPRAWIYQRRFLKSLGRKIQLKAQMMPDAITTKHLEKIKTIRQFDDLYTAPLHGFKNSEDYYNKNSSRFFLSKIKTPTLILNAENDPFLTQESLNHELTDNLSAVHLETTKQGGHVGYAQFGNQNVYWSEERALDFCRQHWIS